MQEDSHGKHKKRVYNWKRSLKGMILLSCFPGGGGGIPGNYWWGCPARFSKSWLYFRPKSVNFQPVFRPGPRFLKVATINGPVKAVVVYMQGRGFNSFASNMTKLSVNETEWSSLLARTRALILYILISKFDFGPKTLPKRAPGL